MKALKNIIITHLVVLALFGGAAMALAQESDTSTSSTPVDRAAAQEDRAEQINERRQEAESNQAERREQIETRQAEIQTNIQNRREGLEARAQTRIINLAANMSNRMEAVIERIQNISDRINSRIEKLKEQGVDTTAAEAALASAQISIDAAAEEIEDIDARVQAAVGSEDIRTSWAVVKTSYLSIRDHLKTARTELRAAIAELKAAVADYQSDNNGNGVNEAVQTEAAEEEETN